jgi:hypothetical protein
LAEVQQPAQDGLGRRVTVVSSALLVGAAGSASAQQINLDSDFITRHNIVAATFSSDAGVYMDR